MTAIETGEPSVSDDMQSEKELSEVSHERLI
jgi:hypothetical protein